MLVSILSVCGIRESDEVIAVVVGDSIVLSVPNESLGWHGDWGMAASVRQWDWHHIVDREGGVVVRSPQVDRACPCGFVSCADIVQRYSWPRPSWLIVQIAEHFFEQTAGLTTESEINVFMGKLRAAADKWGARMVCVNRWTAGCPPHDPSSNVVKSDAILRDYCDAIADIDDIGCDPATRGYPPDADGSVQWHPNDLGMRRIADAVLGAMGKAPVPVGAQPLSPFKAALDPCGDLKTWDLFVNTVIEELCICKSTGPVKVSDGTACF